MVLSPIDDDTDLISDGIDNCIGTANPDQQNSDSIIVLAGKPFNDSTAPNSDSQGDACDPDDDNDGLSDVEETSGGGCGGVPTDPLFGDSDGDNFLDGAECAVGTNPTSVVSRPPLAMCGAAGDVDGDGVLDSREFCFYNTDPGSKNTDGDACSDAKEIASVDASPAVNVIDLMVVASEAGPYSLPGNAVKRDVDVTKNGSIDVIDLMFVARQAGACGD
jgi:hypothetical protein